MANIDVRYDFAQLNQTALALTLGAKQRLLAETKAALARRLAQADAEIVQNLSGSVLKRGTGNLARSVRHRLEQQGPSKIMGEVGILAGSGPVTKYAAIHLTGGVITPKRAQFLAIPLPAARTASGVPRYGSPLRETLKAAFPAGTFVAKGVLFGKLGATTSGRLKTKGGSNIVALFALKKSVTIPKRDYLSAPRTRLFAGLSEDVMRILHQVMSGT